jgi:hypothetical protein
MALRTFSDIVWNQELKMSATNPEVEIAVEPKQIATQFQRLRATLTFATMSDSDISLATLPDIG